MRSYFSRIFVLGTLLLLATLIIVGSFFHIIVRSYLNDTTLAELKTNSNTIARLASAYFMEDEMSGHDFLVNISVAASVSGADAVICDTKGRLLLCSDAPMGCIHQGRQVSEAFVERVLLTGSVADTGVLSGLYETPRYVVSVPVLADNGTPVGIVILSAPLSETSRVLTRLSNFYIYISGITIVGALLIMLILVRKQSTPLKEMVNAAVAFGHGDMSARIRVNKYDPLEVQEMAIAFNNMAVSLEKMDAQRTEFVANVSHELKTPMTVIGGYVDGILDGTIPPEKQEYYMQIVSHETKRLSRLVRNMLEISRMQAKEGFTEEEKLRFDICECAGQVLLSFEQRIVEKELAVDVQFPEDPLYTMANKDAIVQVLYNLVDNAVKFCKQGGQLRLTITDTDGKIRITVANDGPAIPAEELPFVFERFHKLDKSRNRKQEGWGLGLYIVKTLVCGHGEDISVTSREDDTAFTFTLPSVI
ncbi:MAG: HAMP domain-containing histidine kinase [Ruminococcaceae bacterium]|nr:HAMP domain-containing histidine kinase [Oscillospiraceae bacterium]